MDLAVVVYSYTGNNRLLAAELARRLKAPLIEVRERRRRRNVTIALDLMFRRRPAIEPLDPDPAGFGHVLFLAPLWDMHVAHPMASAMRVLAGRVAGYSFVSFAGYDRPGQHQAVREELTGLMGAPPAHQRELIVGELFDEADRRKIRVVSAHRVTQAELARFEQDVAAIAGWFAGRGAES